MSDVPLNRIDTVAGNLASPSDYLALLKPRVMSLVVFTALVGMVMAPGGIHPVLGFTALLCIAIGAREMPCAPSTPAWTVLRQQLGAVPKSQDAQNGSILAYSLPTAMVQSGINGIDGIYWRTEM